MIEPLELVFDVACSPQHAFDTWATDTSRWWPPSHSVSTDPGLIVTLEPGKSLTFRHRVLILNAATAESVEREFETFAAAASSTNFRR